MTLNNYRAKRNAWLGLGLATFLVFSTLASAPPALAQDDVAEQLSVAQQIATLFAELDEKKNQIDTLNADLRKERGTAATLMRAQITEQEAKYRRRLSSLTELLTDTPNAGKGFEEARARLASLLKADEQQLKASVDEQQGRIRDLVTVEDTGSTEEQTKAAEQVPVEIERSDQLFKDWHQNLENQKALDLDVGKDEAKLRERLQKRAEFSSGALREAKTTLEQIAKTPGLKEDAEAQKQMATQREYLGMIANSQRVTVGLLDKYGVDTTDYRQGIISATGEISDDILNVKVAKGLVEESTANAVGWVKTHGAGLLFRFGVFLFILFLTWLAARIARRLTGRALERHQTQFDISSLARTFLIRSAGRLIWVFGTIVAIAQLGIQLGPVLAGLGIAGFVIGFALQDTLANFASGMLILLYRPFDIGDFIEAGGVSGKVSRMNLVSTMIITPDNQMLVVPNNQIWGNVIRNVTHQTERRVDLTFGIGYADDIDKAETVLSDIVASHEKVLKEPEAVVRLHELADSSVNFVVRPWVKTDDYWDVYWDLTREVKRRFDAEGISIPFPQTDVHLYRADAADAGLEGYDGPAQRSKTDLSAQTADQGA